MRIVVGTNNEGKVKEIRKIFENTGLELVTLKDIGMEIDVVEDGTTFEENAMKKAKEICEACGEIVMADDSGLEVDYLNGAPGVYSARFSEPNPTPEKNRLKLLQELSSVPFEKRTARFVTVIAVAFPNGDIFTKRGECHGYISEELRGEAGFAYDPLFYYPDFGMTFAEAGQAKKNEVSHRGRALEKVKPELVRISRELSVR